MILPAVSYARALLIEADGVVFALIALTGLVLPLAQAGFITDQKYVAPTALLYIYADTMNDFNFYTEREVFPVLSSR
jgi:hypothetical protein